MEDKPESPLAALKEPSRFRPNVEENREIDSFFLKEDRSASLGMFQKKKLEPSVPHAGEDNKPLEMSDTLE